MLRLLPLRYFSATVYTKEQVLKPLLNRGFKNAFEMLNPLPQFGVGAKLRKRTWSEDCYYTVTKVTYKDPRCGKLYGVLTWKGETEEEAKRISGGLKLGVWRYEPRVKPASAPSDQEKPQSEAS